MPKIDSTARKVLDPGEALDRPDAVGGVDGTESVDAVGVRDPGQTAEVGEGVDLVRRREVGGKMLAADVSPRKIAKELGVAESTVYSWRAKLAEVGLENIGQRRPPGVKPAFDADDLKKIEGFLRDPNVLAAYSGKYWKLEKVQSLISYKMGKFVSLSYASRLLKRLGLTRQTSSRSDDTA